MPSRSRRPRPNEFLTFTQSKGNSMQRTLRNLAVALVAGTFAVAAAAQDKAEKASKKAAASASGKLVVNGVPIPQSRIDPMNKELTAQGQPDTAERQQAGKDELVNPEVLAQAASKRGLDRNPHIAAQMDKARQTGVRAG